MFMKIISFFALYKQYLYMLFNAENNILREEIIAINTENQYEINIIMINLEDLVLSLQIKTHVKKTFYKALKAS